MRSFRLHPRPRPRRWRSGAFCARILGLTVALAAARGGAGAAAGQEPQRPDTLPRPRTPDTLVQRLPGDTLAPPPPQDTVAGQAAADTAPPPPPPPALVRMPRPEPQSWTTGVWEWNRAELTRLPNLSLLQLLERVPGLTTVRPIVLGQPEGAAVFGSSLRSIRLVVDGYEVDPLLTPTFDPSKMALLGIEHVRVERGLTEATVRIRTLSPSLPGPESVIEAATGDYGVNLFRGVFMAPAVLGGPLAAGFERLSAEVGAPSNLTAAWLKWSWARDSTGVQLEFRQQGVDRSGVGPAEKSTRRDWALRARRPLGPFAAEAYVGGSSVEDEAAAGVLREGTTQAGLRLAGGMTAPFPAGASMALRWRSHPRLPDSELDLALWARPLPVTALGGRATEQRWGAETVGHWSARAELGPLLGLTAFGEIFRAGPEAGPSLRMVPASDSLSPIQLTREGIRAGARLAGYGFVLGAATVRLKPDSIAAFGLPFEGAATPLPGGEAKGIEAIARIPSGWRPLYLEGWYVGMDAPEGWLYLPDYNWRAALVYHHLPLPSGHLELYARAEHVFRGRMSVWAPTGLDEVGSYRATNLEISIRVITLTAFLRWDNALYTLHIEPQRDFPSPDPELSPSTFMLPGQHLVYGVKWTFTN